MNVSILIISYRMYWHTQKYLWFSAYCVQYYPAFVANQDLGKVPDGFYAVVMLRYQAILSLPVKMLNL